MSVLGLVCLVTLRLRYSVYRRADTTEPGIALTFDDGPNPPFTDRILDVLARYHIRATFFFIGRNIEMHRTTALKVAAAGHEIGNHSYWHRHLRFAWPSAIREEIETTDRLIRLLGYHGPIPFRSPFGEVLLSPALALVGDLWHQAERPDFLYDVGPEPPDYLRADPIRIARSTLARVRPGSVILFHDGEGIRTETVIAVEETIRALLARGYRFETVSTLFFGAGEPLANREAPTNTSALK